MRLGHELGRGGEAVVYEVPGRDLLAKVYVAPRPEYREKLQVMRSSPPADPTLAIGHASIAWPRQLTFDESGRFVGYLMAYIRNAVSLLEVFNPRLRSNVLPGFNRAYLHRAARNLSSALEALHARDYIVGDLNERNALVTPRALVTLIDTDSFQVQEIRDSRIVVYPCPVGRSEYTPPELQTRAFRGVMRRPEHDRFGLGVLLFQLLMEGNHPFRSQWLGAGDPPSVESKIARGWFPYTDSAPAEVAAPPGAPGLDLIHPRLRDLFLRCFADAHERPSLRPSAAEWADGIGEAERHLVVCGNDHHYSDHLRKCPVCGAGKGVLARIPRARRQEVVAGGSGGARYRTPSSRGTSPAGAPRPGTVVHRTAAAIWAPFDELHQSITRVGSRSQRLYGATFGALLALPRRTVRTVANQAMSPHVAVGNLERLQRRLAWTALLAITGAALGIGVGFLLVSGFDALWPGLAAALYESGATPVGVWSGLVGMSVMGIVSAFRTLAPSQASRPVAGELRSAVVRALWATAGWLIGWSLISLVVGVGGGEGLALATVGSAGFPSETHAFGEAAGWTLGWSIYGAIAGAVVGTVREEPRGWLAGGAVFGAAGWAALRVLAAL